MGCLTAETYTEVTWYFCYSTLAARIAGLLTFSIGLRQERELITEPPDLKAAEDLEIEQQSCFALRAGTPKRWRVFRKTGGTIAQRVSRFDSFAIRVSSVT